jgi:hypothetical protein
LVASTKPWQQSSEVIIKEKVFINPNLTGAEAAAAYLTRVQRRFVQQRQKEESANNAIVPENINSNSHAQNMLILINGGS